LGPALAASSSNYRAIAFDLGGVLLDSEDAHENAARRTAAHFRLYVPEEQWSRIRGDAYEDFFDEILALPENARYGLKPLQIILRAYAFYHEEARRSARPFEDAIEVLEYASGQVILRGGSGS
jgi:beta-phosphoglucomutase-like phosphatase (HAD superfamily)